MNFLTDLRDQVREAASITLTPLRYVNPFGRWSGYESMIELIVRPERASYEVAELGSERVSVPSGVDPEIMDPLLFERKVAMHS